MRVNNREFKKIIFYPELAQFCPINHQNTFMSRKIFEKYGLFNEDLTTGMDWDLFVRLAGKVDIYFVNRVFTVWRLHSERNISMKEDYLRKMLDIKKVINEQKEEPFLWGLRQMKDLDRLKYIRV